MQILIPDNFDLSLLKTTLYELVSARQSYKKTNTLVTIPTEYWHILCAYFDAAGIRVLDTHKYDSMNIKYTLYHPEEYGMDVDYFCSLISDYLYKRRMSQIIEEECVPSALTKPRPSMNKYLFISLVALNATQFVIILALIFGAKP